MKVEPNDGHGRRSLDSTLARGVLWTGAVKWMIQLISWPVTILTAHLLSPEDYGYLALVSIVTRFASMLTEAGLGAAIVTGAALDEDQIRQVNSVSTLFGAGGALFVFLVSWPVAHFYGDAQIQPVLSVIGLTALLEGAALVPAASLRRRLDFRQLAFAEAARNLVDIFTTLILAYVGAKYWSLVFGYTAGVATWLVIVRVVNPVAFARPHRERLAAVLKFSRLLVCRNVAGFFAFSGDAAIGGLSLSKHALGNYTFAMTIATAPADKITQLILRVAPAVLGKVRDSRPDLARYFLAITSVITLVTVPLFAGIAIVAGDLIPLLLGPQWIGVVSVIIPLCIYGVCTEIVSVAQHVLMTVGETRVLARNGLLALLVMPLSFFVLSRAFGAVGLGSAWALGSIILAIGPLAVACRSIDVSAGQFLRSVRTPLLGSSAMLAVLLLLRVSGLTDAWSPTWRLVAFVPLGAATYAASVFILDASRVRGLLTLLLELRRNQASPQAPVGLPS